MLPFHSYISTRSKPIQYSPALVYIKSDRTVSCWWSKANGCLLMVERRSGGSFSFFFLCPLICIPPLRSEITLIVSNGEFHEPNTSPADTVCAILIRLMDTCLCRPTEVKWSNWVFILQSYIRTLWIIQECPEGWRQKVMWR